jgi:hypothetical protein
VRCNRKFLRPTKQRQIFPSFLLSFFLRLSDKLLPSFLPQDWTKKNCLFCVFAALRAQQDFNSLSPICSSQTSLQKREILGCCCIRCCYHNNNNKSSAEIIVKASKYLNLRSPRNGKLLSRPSQDVNPSLMWPVLAHWSHATKSSSSRVGQSAHSPPLLLLLRLLLPLALHHSHFVNSLTKLSTHLLLLLSFCDFSFLLLYRLFDAAHLLTAFSASVFF